MVEVRCGKQPAVEALGWRCPEELKTQRTGACRVMPPTPRGRPGTEAAVPQAAPSSPKLHSFCRVA